jgi:hypothetical protein
MRKHTHLPAMVRLVSNHVAKHLHTNRPRRSPAISPKPLDTAPIISERLREHLPAASCALGQCSASLLRRAASTVEQQWNLQVRRSKPDPLGADIVHMRENRRNRAHLSRRCGPPRSRIQMFDKVLVHAVIGSKHLHRGSTDLSVNLVSTRGHGFSIDVVVIPKTGNPKNKSERCGVFFTGKLRSSSDHLSPAFHHDFTIKKPRSDTMFSQNPLQKHGVTTIKKITAEL